MARVMLANYLRNHSLGECSAKSVLSSLKCNQQSVRYINSTLSNMLKMAAVPAANSTQSNSYSFLEMLKQQLDSNLAQYKPGAAKTTKDVFDMKILQREIALHESVQASGIKVSKLFHNSAPGTLYEEAVLREPGTHISSTGALCVSSGAKTGRCPQDKRVVKEETTQDEVWWGSVNMPFDEHSYEINRARVIDYLNLQDRLYVIDAFAGWDKESRIKVRVITTRAYHALFMRNMLVLATPEETLDFVPDFTIYNAGCFPANPHTEGVTSQTSVALNFKRMELCILGTQYAGEMKKGILTLMMYLMPKRGLLPLHSSANLGPKGDVTLFFGLSGTGKTTLSADPARQLIGDDEHVWTDKGVFNIEGGCYAKCKDLSSEQEPEIWDAIKFGSVLENVVLDGDSRVVDYSDISITENTRCAYPLEYIPNAKLPAIVDTHPSNIILLTCDAFGVLPPVSKLTPEQVMYHFISGYTSKMAGTEMGIKEPTATFSACYGAPFLVLHPTVYAEMLAAKMKAHSGNAWLINTGWVCGRFGEEGSRRIPLKYTRAIIDAIHDGTLAKADYETMPIFNLSVPTSVEGVPAEILSPAKAWADKQKLNEQAINLATRFQENFKAFSDKSSSHIIKAGPQC